jgi:hypothetical protein
MLKISVVILTVLLVLSSIYSVVVLMSPTMVLEGDFQAITGKTYQEVLQPDAVRVALVHIRHMEVFAIATAISCVFILFAGFRKAEKWAWWAMLILGVVAWGYGTALNVVIGNTSDFTFFLCCFVVHIVALFLPIKSFFSRTA